MKEGQLKKCEDDPWCGQYFPAHRSKHPPHDWVRFKRGHNRRTPEGKEQIRNLGKKTGAKNIKKWITSSEGKEQIRNLGKKYRNKLKEYRDSTKGKKQQRRLGKKYGGKSHDTKYEWLMRQKPKERGIKFIHQYPIPRNGHGHYSIDIYLPKYEVALEIDGAGHLSKRIKKRDIKRGADLLRDGIRTVRVRNKDVAKFTKKKLMRLVGEL